MLRLILLSIGDLMDSRCQRSLSYWCATLYDVNGFSPRCVISRDRLEKTFPRTALRINTYLVRRRDLHDLYLHDL
jgi:hypothetical protein